MNALSISSIDVKRCELNEFKRLANEYCALVNQFGFNIKAHRDWDVLNFERCDLALKKRAILYLDANLEILKECVTSGENPKNSARLLWRILRKIKATPEADLFDKLGENDVIEVYLDDHTQIFRNLEFFNHTSFTIDELLCGTLQSTTAWNVPTHIFHEVGSSESLKQLIDLKYVSPLKNNGKRIGAICTSTATRC